MMNDDAGALVELIKQDMRQAMKDRERVTLDALRSLLARISNAEAVVPSDGAGLHAAGRIAGAVEGVGSSEMPRKQLMLADVVSILHDEVREINTALNGIDPKSDYAAALREKAKVIAEYIR